MEEIWYSRTHQDLLHSAFSLSIFLSLNFTQLFFLILIRYESAYFLLFFFSSCNTSPKKKTCRHTNTHTSRSFRSVYFFLENFFLNIYCWWKKNKYAATFEEHFINPKAKNGSAKDFLTLFTKHISQQKEITASFSTTTDEFVSFFFAKFTFCCCFTRFMLIICFFWQFKALHDVWKMSTIWN